MKSPVEERFIEFYEKWMCQLEENLQRLLKVSREIPHRTEREALVSRVTTHLKEYYNAKWAAAHEDVLAFFSPVWLSPLENAYLWVTGWKPSTAFRLIESLRQTGVPGESLAEMQQVALADRKMVELARAASRVSNGGLASEENGLVEVALKGLLSGLERVMKAADCARLKTLKGILEVLSPLQCVDFLAATLMFHVNLRKWGIKRAGPHEM
ncbi:unnamed protein product, partial [Vitis vinifera]